ncbi:unnamed protein product [Rotaria socialis]
MNYMITTPSQQQVQSQKDVDNDPTLNRMTVQSSINNRQQQQQSIEKQLVLLLHAHGCQQRETQTIDGETPPSSTCTLPHCSKMKNVLQYMTKCDDHKSCTVTDCATSRQITLHWKQCKNSQCPICQPVKISSTLAKLNQAPTNNNSTTTVSLPINKEWQRYATQEMRNHSVQKIMTALIPIADTGAMRDKRIINLANYARRVESETFEIATNQEEYFHKLAEKIHRIQKELEERREKKRVQDMQLVIQPSSSTIPDFNAKMNPDPIIDDRMLLQIRTTTSLNDYLSSTASNSFQCTTKSESLMALTNVPSNEILSFLLNRDTTISSQAHDMDTKNSLNGNQFKNKLS